MTVEDGAGRLQCSPPSIDLGILLNRFLHTCQNHCSENIGAVSDFKLGRPNAQLVRLASKLHDVLLAAMSRSCRCFKHLQKD